MLRGKFKPGYISLILWRIVRPRAAMADVQTGLILIAEAMDTQEDSLKPKPAIRAAAFRSHIFTAFGAAIALLAMLEAVREHWAAMFQWLITLATCNSINRYNEINHKVLSTPGKGYDGN